MKVSHPRALLISLVVAIVLSVVAGTLYSIFGDRQLIWATGTMLLISGLIALTMGLLGALEPPEGWATGVGAGRRQEGRRSVASRLAREHPTLEEGSSWSLLVWGLAVGGGLIALSMAAFALS